MLFPMIHIGSSEYYAQVHIRLKACDLVLYEGVRTLSGQILTLAYRLVARRKRLRLVTQSVALPLKGIGAKLVCADASSGEFQQSWKQIPLHARLALVIAAPIFGAYQYLVATRESIGKHISTEDIQSREDLESREFHPEFHGALLDSRDAKLSAAIESVLADPDAPAVAGVIYGAGHMRSATDLLMSKHGYRVVNAEWLTAFDYADL